MNEEEESGRKRLKSAPAATLREVQSRPNQETMPTIPIKRLIQEGATCSSHTSMNEEKESGQKRRKSAPAATLRKVRSRPNQETMPKPCSMSVKIDINAQNAMINEVGVAYGRVMLLGPSGVGKTSLLCGLKNEQFIQSGTSTQVADVRHIHQFWVEGYAGREWKEVSEQDELDEMAKLLAAGSHDSRSAEQIISSVKSVKELYSSSHLESANAEITADTGSTQTEEIEKYLQNAIKHAQHLTQRDVCDLRPAPFLHIWDCGGQQVFLEVLPAFLTPRTMFLTLFDASKNFDETFHSIQLRCGEKVVEEDVGITILHLINTWMSMIHTYLSRKVKGVFLDYPQVSLVGTHGDQLIGDHKYQECQMMMNQIKSRFELIQSTYVVDNTTAGKGKEGEDPNYAKLRQEIYDFTANSLVVSTPVSWVLYRKIMQMFIKASKNIISYSEAKAIATACKIADEDVPKALAFYHDLGVILYYPKVAGLRDKVILSPNWFVECLGKVLSLKGNEKYNMPGMWKLFREKGILVQSLYGAVWRNNEGGIDPQSIMELLVHLHLAAEVKTQQYPDRDVLQYFVPCVLKNFVSEFSAPVIKMQLISSPVHVKFNTVFVPPGYFTRFTTTMASYEACKLDFEHGIFRNRVSFLFSEGTMKYDHVTFTQLPDAIQVDISRNAPDTENYPSFSKSCQSLLQIIKLSCKEVEDLYHQSMMGNTSSPLKVYSQLKLVCTSIECLINTDEVHYLSIDDLSEHKLTASEKIKCEKSAAFRSFCNEEKHWFPLMKRVTKKSQLSQKEMLEISRAIDNGDDLAAELEMLDCWRQIVNDNTIKSKILHLLFAFGRDGGERDTLVGVLKSLNHGKLAEQLVADTSTINEFTPATTGKNLYKRHCVSIPISPALTSPPITTATTQFDFSSSAIAFTEPKVNEQTQSVTAAVKKCTLQKADEEYKTALLLTNTTHNGIKNSANDEHKVEKSQDQHINKVHVGLQFDYWVPMEDLLHGATVVDEVVFNAHGDKEQKYHWSECGFSLLVPEGALSRTATCPVAVKALISGRFLFPKGFQLISALYAISPGRKFTKDVKITLQHCFLIQRAEQLKRLCIVKAYPTKPDNPYVFEIVKGGAFKFGSQYCEVWLSDFSDVAAGILTEMPDDNGSSNDSHNSSDGEESGSNGEGDKTVLVESKKLSKQSEKKETEALDQEISGNQRDPTNIQPSIEVQPSVDSGMQSLSELSSSNEGDIQLYRAHFFMESLSKNRWNFKLVGVKHLGVHIKYVNDTFEADEKIAAFKFHFHLSELKEQEPAITLEFTEEENKQIPRGWFVKPLTEPCSITQEDIDALSTQELRVQAHEEERVYPDIPMCMVSVFAEDSASPHIQYGVKVEGIVEKKTVNIVRWLQGEITVHNQAHAQPQEIPDFANLGEEIQGDPNIITDCKKLKELLNSQLNGIFADLKDLLQGTLESFASKLFQEGLISKDVKSSQQYGTIMGELMGSLKFKRNPKEAIQHCKKILSTLADLGQPQKEAAHSIAMDMTDAIRRDFNTNIKFL